MKAVSPVVVIVGCGRLGSCLATLLDREGCAVRLVDRDAAAFSLLPEHLAGACFEGDPLELTVLKRAGIRGAEWMIATTSSDNTNSVLALVGQRVFGTANVVARVLDPHRAESYGRLGIRTVCPTILVASSLLRLIEEAGRA